MARAKYFIRVIIEDNHSHGDFFLHLPILDNNAGKLKDVELLVMTERSAKKVKRGKVVQSPFKVIGKMQFK